MARKADPRTFHTSGGVTYDNTGAVVNPNTCRVYEESRETQRQQQRAYERAQREKQAYNNQMYGYVQDARKKAGGIGVPSFGLGGLLGGFGSFIAAWFMLVAIAGVLMLGIDVWLWVTDGISKAISFIRVALRAFFLAWPVNFSLFYDAIFHLELFKQFSMTLPPVVETTVLIVTLVKRYQYVRLDGLHYLENLDIALCFIPNFIMEMVNWRWNADLTLSETIFYMLGLSVFSCLFVSIVKHIAQFINDHKGVRTTPFSTLFENIVELAGWITLFIEQKKEEKQAQTDTNEDE